MKGEDVFQATYLLAKKYNNPRAKYGYAPRRVDDNQPAIVKAFRQMGIAVKHTHQAGDGFTDIVTAYEWLNVLVEIKDGDKRPSARKFTDKEYDFFSNWPGLKAVACNVDDVFRISEAMKGFVRCCTEARIIPHINGNLDPQYFV